VSALARVLTVTEMQAHDLRRRRVAVGLLVALPLAFYFSLLGQPEDPFVFVAGGIGMAWSVAGAALFSMLAARRIDPRLVLSGYRPHELLLGRLLLLEAFALALLFAFTALIRTNERGRFSFRLRADGDWTDDDERTRIRSGGHPSFHQRVRGRTISRTPRYEVTIP
jgi:hypothetical protein